MSISIGYQENSTNQALFRFSPRELKFILYLSRKWFSKYDVVTASQATFAEHEGVSTRTINEWLRHLYAFGYVEKKRNALNKFDTCEYRPTALLKRSLPHIRQLYVMFKYAALTISISTCTSEPDFVPYKDIRGEETRDCYSSPFLYLKTLSLSLTPESQIARVCAREKHPPEKEFKVEIQSSMPEWITPQIKKATELLGLTKWGQIKLTAYPPSAIEHAIQALGGSKGKKDNAFSWFASVCYGWCKQRNVSPDWTAMNSLASKHGMPQDARFIVEGTLAQSVSPEEKTARERGLKEIREKRDAEHKEQQRAKQRAWEETKTDQDLKERMEAILPQTEKLSPFKDPEEHRREIIRSLQAKPNINPTERIILEIYKHQMGFKESKWSPEEQELMDWSLQFIKEISPRVDEASRDWYESLRISIEQGPESPQAQSRELQDGLQKLREMIEKSEAKKQVKEESRNDPEAQAANYGVYHPNGARPLEASRLQLQQESIL